MEVAFGTPGACSPRVLEFLYILKHASLDSRVPLGPLHPATPTLSVAPVNAERMRHDITLFELFLLVNPLFRLKLPPECQDFPFPFDCILDSLAGQRSLHRSILGSWARWLHHGFYAN